MSERADRGRGVERLAAVGVVDRVSGVNEQGSVDGVLRRYAVRPFRVVLRCSRLRSFSPVLPLVLLLIGFSTTILFGNVYTGYFSNPVFSEHLTMAMNLSLDNHLLGFRYQSFDTEGNIDWDPYNRFPPGGYALIKLITYPFKGDLSILVYVAALFMLALFVGAAVLAYLSLCRLTSNRWIALTATLMGFSSTILLQYNTTIFVDGGPSLFGFSLTFYGMVIFAQEGRFKQLIVKACFALLLGWHVLALLVAFVILGLAKEVIIHKARTFREFAAAVVTSRYFILGVVTFGFGLLILTHNMANEYYALNIRGDRQLALSDLPSFRSMLRRTQLATNYTPKDDTLLVPFLELQFERLGLTVVPWIGRMSVLGSYWTGLLVVVACSVGAFFVRNRLLTATVILAGFCWTVRMFHTSYRHDHESIYYVGISLFFVTLILLIIRKLTANLDVGRNLFMPLGSIVSLFIFGLSSYHMVSVGVHNKLRFQELSEEFDTIRVFTKGKTLLAYKPDDLTEPSDSIWVNEQAIQLLSGNGNSIIFYDFEICDSSLNKVDFIIQTKKENVPSLLTPQNQVVFLYDRYAYEERIDKLVEEDRSVFRGINRGAFDVYLTGRKLIYVGSNCDKSLPLNVPISLSIYPVDTEDIPDPS